MESGTVLTVSRLVNLLKELVEDNFVQVVVRGEISNFSSPASGHYYFALKDDRHQMKAVMFRMHNRALDFVPKNGMEVMAQGHMSLYPQRGELQLVVDKLQPCGLGSQQIALEELRARLAGEGLFDPSRKRKLPAFPVTIGVVTSATGAAIHDILNVLRRRGSGLKIILCPVPVQGGGAAKKIAAAIEDLNRHARADVLIVGRGGGAPEDLHAFNEEPVARAIYASAIPVIAAVGHEIDFSIADQVADLRAPTPSAAAELVVKERRELESHIDHLTFRLCGQMNNRLTLLRERINGLENRLQGGLYRIDSSRQQVRELLRRVEASMHARLQYAATKLQLAAGRLDSLSPLATLQRGYAIVTCIGEKKAIRDTAELEVGASLHLRFSHGSAEAVVTSLDSEAFRQKPLD
jgi:exodeoxyribonuclease VII large subunit